ncbi:hypothetical protein FSP39_016102 [Pinctada imbricata]|uniref:rRNA-processing protein UTP23 homolog n=1 Tax=Pinctada imbricata TaxID=66713 RepID=A0AA88XV92_PINIB|nr:hypothetical protein FSP39_016102 [Pinctada imbricata]
MKVKRYKHIKKTLNFYKNNFGLTSPYQVLVDGTFCKAALKDKINISEQLPKYLQAEVKLSTTDCAKRECEAFGSLLYGPLKVLQQFQVTKCGHKKPVSGAAECLRRTARKRPVIIIGTQDSTLKEELRGVPGQPLLFIAHNAITMETPAGTSKDSATSQADQRIHPTEHAKSVLDKLKIETFGEQPVPKKKKKKHKGKNPLSCLKSKKKRQIPKVLDGSVKKRRRKKKIKLVGIPKEMN